MSMLDDRRWVGLNNPYQYRNDNLRRLGFKSYRAYLRSALWADIRRRVLVRDKCQCRRCFLKATQVHHRAYDPATLRGDCIDALSAVCGKCHARAEYKKAKAVEKNIGQQAYQRLMRANADILMRRKARHTRTKPAPKPRLVKKPDTADARIEPEYRPFWG